MPRDGATTIGDLFSQLVTPRVECDQCGRSGRYRLETLITAHGRDAKIPVWLADLVKNCPQRPPGATAIGHARAPFHGSRARADRAPQPRCTGLGPGTRLPSC